jgi:hypothetical protein
MYFTLDKELLSGARSVLWERTDIYWIIGGSCSGKSTISRAMSKRIGIPVYDMDTYVFDRYMGKYLQGRHPASLAWFSSPNPLAWSLSLSWDEFESMYKAANAEYLDLLAEDLRDEVFEGALIVDGGITHPSVLVQVLKPEQVVCLDINEDERTQIWETSQDRTAMKQWVYDLTDPEEKWSKFLSFDNLITKAIVEESRQEQIRIFFRGKTTTIEDLTDQIIGHFSL